MWRELKGDAAIIVLLAGGFEIEVGEGDSAHMPGRQIKKSHADDGVVSEFQFATVFEDEKGRFLRRVGIRRGHVVIVILNNYARHGSISYWRDVGSCSGTASVENRGTSVVVGVAVIGVVVVDVIRC